MCILCVNSWILRHACHRPRQLKVALFNSGGIVNNQQDQLRKQLDTIKSESSSRKNSTELEDSLREKDEVIGQLQEEGEKLARQQLQHSNIIKKLRAKEKDNEQLNKSLK